MDKLKQIKLLGEGAFGKCYLCENPEDKSQWVVKQIDISSMSPQEKKEAYHEAKVMAAFDHPNIIKFINVYTTTNGKLNIVMNFADGGDLSSKIRGQRGTLFTENEILDIFVQISLAIKHVHDRKVLHRDIKAQNVFLMKSGMIKLGDFGISKVLSNTVEKARTMVGTPYYLSPEIVENRPYSFKSDVWSLGVLLYELCTLKPPFDGTSIRQLSLNIVRGIYPPIAPHFSRDLKLLISQMLTVDPNRRPTVAQVLRMPFIKSRIENLLSESKRFEEFSHTILHKQQLFNPKAEIKKEPPKPEIKKEPPKPEIKKEPPKPEIKKEPPKLEIKEIKKDPPKGIIQQLKDSPTPKAKYPDPKEKKFEIDLKKFCEIKENRKAYEPNPRINEGKEIKKMIEMREAKIAEKEQAQAKELKKIMEIQEAKFAEKQQAKAVQKPPIMPGRLEDFFKPVEKPKKSEPSPKIKEEIKKKKEIEAKKKLEEMMQKRENSRLEAIARQEAAAKKKDEKLKKIQEEREKMINDIKIKKSQLNNTPPVLESAEILPLEDKQPIKTKEKPKYENERKKMMEALRQKRRKSKDDFAVEWVGVKNPEEQSLYKKLEEAIQENAEDDIYITEIPEEEEEIIDRQDEIADKEIIIIERTKSVENNYDMHNRSELSETDVGSTYNSLESMRDFLESKMGDKMLIKAYNAMKEIGEIDSKESGQSIYYEKLGDFIPLEHMEEYVSYLKTLIILENHADSYLEGLIRNKSS
jgi:NIMA (never in mitosis gene a)-related kinase 1/4/5